MFFSIFQQHLVLAAPDLALFFRFYRGMGRERGGNVAEFKSAVITFCLGEALTAFEKALKSFEEEEDEADSEPTTPATAATASTGAESSLAAVKAAAQIIIAEADLPSDKRAEAWALIRTSALFAMSVSWCVSPLF
jgi:hypothetical protein